MASGVWELVTGLWGRSLPFPGPVSLSPAGGASAPQSPCKLWCEVRADSKLGNVCATGLSGACVCTECVCTDPERTPPAGSREWLPPPGLPRTRTGSTVPFRDAGRQRAWQALGDGPPLASGSSSVPEAAGKSPQEVEGKPVLRPPGVAAFPPLAPALDPTAPSAPGSALLGRAPGTPSRTLAPPTPAPRPRLTGLLTPVSNIRSPTESEPLVVSLQSPNLEVMLGRVRWAPAPWRPCGPAAHPSTRFCELQLHLCKVLAPRWEGRPLQPRRSWRRQHRASS